MKLHWLEPGDSFPPASRAWGPHSPAPGLLAAGGVLDVASLKRAYSGGIFPWFSEGQPNLWWSPDPRMVLRVSEFKLHRSLRKAINQFRLNRNCEIRIDSAFNDVIRACATSARPGQAGTWIVEDMVRAYESFHEAGFAHSVETWVDGQLVGGLYLVALGRAVFGESMFTRVPDASKIALAGLVSLCRHGGVTMIDCQQNTRHLASLGAREIERSDFLLQVQATTRQAGPLWQFEPVYWSYLLHPLASA